MFSIYKNSLNKLGQKFSDSLYIVSQRQHAPTNSSFFKYL